MADLTPETRQTHRPDRGQPVTPQERAHIDWQITRQTVGGWNNTDYAEWLAQRASERVTDMQRLAADTGEDFNELCAEVLATLTASVSVPGCEWDYAIEVARTRAGLE